MSSSWEEPDSVTSAPGANPVKLLLEERPLPRRIPVRAALTSNQAWGIPAAHRFEAVTHADSTLWRPRTIDVRGL
jgi:hypothetical protein